MSSIDTPAATASPTDGMQKDVQASTTSTFVTALVIAAITVGVCTVFWLLFHGSKSYKRVFQPRTVLAEPDKRAEALPAQPVAFWRRVFTLDDSEVLFLNGPDAYFFLRFLKVFGFFCLVPYVFLTVAVCIPAAAAKPNGGQLGVNQLTFGNTPREIPTRRVAHFLVAVILMLWTLYLIVHEYNHYMEVRLNWLRSDRNSTKSRTVAMVNVPEAMFSEAGIKEIGGTVAGMTGTGTQSHVGEAGSSMGAKASGGITNVWLARKVKPIEKVYDRRDKECGRLENGVGKLVGKANKNQRKGKTPEAKGTWTTESGGSMIDRYVLPKKQPKWKQGPLGLFGTKMNLETSPLYIKEQNDILERERAKINELPEGNVAFVRFERQDEAHNFARFVRKSDKALRMVDTKIEVYPEDIVWSNTSMSWPQRKARTVLSWSLTIGLIIIWSFPVAIVGAWSNVDALKELAPFKWLNAIPDVVLGIIRGAFPAIMMSVLFMLLPIVLRIWIKLQGEIRQSEINLKLFTRYWCFWVVQGFLVVSFASGLINALPNLGSTLSSVPTLLADKLPGASLYFLTYILVSSWAAAAKLFARIVPVVMWHLRGFLAGGTPRKAFAQKYNMTSYDWATTWPTICLLACIVIVYSVIQPLITVIGMVGFIMFYAGYKYVLIWTADQDPEHETGGLFYIKALRTLFVSLYIEQVFLAGLFFLSTTSSEDGGVDPQKNTRLAMGIACGVIIVIVGVITAVTQAWIDHIHFKRDTIIYGVRTKGPISTSQTQLNATEKTVSAEEPKSPLGELSDEHEFDHPALWKPQPIIWICDDPLGVGRYETERINSVGVPASTEFTHMDEKGRITVDRSPPDEEWDNRPYDDDEF